MVILTPHLLSVSRTPFSNHLKYNLLITMSPPQPEEHKPTVTTGETQAKKQKGNNESVSETQQVWALEHLFIH